MLCLMYNTGGQKAEHRKWKNIKGVLDAWRDCTLMKPIKTHLVVCTHKKSVCFPFTQDYVCQHT